MTPINSIMARGNDRADMAVLILLYLNLCDAGARSIMFTILRSLVDVLGSTRILIADTTQLREHEDVKARMNSGLIYSILWSFVVGNMSEEGSILIPSSSPVPIKTMLQVHGVGNFHSHS